MLFFFCCSAFFLKAIAYWEWNGLRYFWWLEGRPLSNVIKEIQMGRWSHNPVTQQLREVKRCLPSASVILKSSKYPVRWLKHSKNKYTSISSFKSPAPICCFISCFCKGRRFPWKILKFSFKNCHLQAKVPSLLGGQMHLWRHLPLRPRCWDKASAYATDPTSCACYTRPTKKCFRDLAQ